MTPKAPSLPPDTYMQRLQHMLKRMAERGLALADSLIEAYTAPAPVPARSGPDHGLAFLRVGRAIRWTVALASLLAGRYRLPTPRPPPAVIADPPPDPGLRDEAEAVPSASRTSDRADDRWMFTVFATRSIGDIAIRLCRDLGIAANTELWPVELVGLTQTPAEWAATFYPQPPQAIRVARRPAACARPSRLVLRLGPGRSGHLPETERYTRRHPP